MNKCITLVPHLHVYVCLYDLKLNEVFDCIVKNEKSDRILMSTRNALRCTSHAKRLPHIHIQFCSTTNTCYLHIHERHKLKFAIAAKFSVVLSLLVSASIKLVHFIENHRQINMARYVSYQNAGSSNVSI